MPTLLHEHVIAEGRHTVDRDSGVIRRVKVLGRESKNGRVYSAAALKQAAQYYDGVEVNLNHVRAQPGQPVPERRVEDGFGTLAKATVESDGVYADLHYLTKHPNADQIAEMAERMPGTFGMSHDASGTLTRGADGAPDMVESIDGVVSVDVVRRPATNAGLFESIQPEEGGVMPRPVKKVLEGIKDNPEAKRLVALLEMEGDAMAAAPVEVASEESPEKLLQASVDQLVIAILHDEALDVTAKVGKIKKILGVIEDAKEPADAGTEGEGGGDAGAEAAMESVTKRLAAMERRDDLRTLCEQHGHTYATLAPERRTLLDAQPDIKTAATIVESWEPATQPGGKPPIGSARGAADTSSYDDLRESTERDRKGRRRRATA